MNEEWRIAAECAVETGGNPVGFAACTATQLTINELTKCFKGGIGTSCFGKNNTVVLTLTNAFHDLTFFEAQRSLGKMHNLRFARNSVWFN